MFTLKLRGDALRHPASATVWFELNLKTQDRPWEKKRKKKKPAGIGANHIIGAPLSI